MVTRESELFAGGALSPLSAAVLCCKSRLGESFVVAHGVVLQRMGDRTQ